jgi:hypothetical protein
MAIRQNKAVRRAGAGLIAALCVVIAAVVFATLETSDVIWRPVLVEHPGYAPIDSGSVQEIWPAVGTAKGAAATLSRAGDAMVAVVAGAGATPSVGSWILVGLVAVVLMFAFIRNLGGGLIAASSGALSMAFAGVFWSRVTSEQPAPMAALLTLGTIGGLFLWARSNRMPALVLAAAFFLLSVAAHPPTVVALPFLAAFTIWGPAPRRRAWLAALTLALSAAVGATAAVITLDGPSPSDWWLSPASRALSDRLIEAAGRLVTDFGVLGIGFLAVGSVALARVRPRILFLLGGWTVATGLAALLWAAPDWQSSLLPALVPAWALVGCGIEWSLREGRRRERAAVAILALALPTLTFFSHYPAGTGARAATTFVDRYLDQLGDMLPEPPVVVAEGGAIDRAVARREVVDPAWSRAAQDPDGLDQLLDSGKLVVGFAGARRNLESLGFRFLPLRDVGLAMTVDELIETLPAGWVIAIAVGSGFARALPPSSEPTFGQIGGTTRLFGANRMRYAIIGGRGFASAAEQTDARAARVAVLAGDPIGPSRAPAALRAESTASGGIVEYAGQRVAETRTGLALAVVRPDGELAGAYQAEASRASELIVDPSNLRAAALVAREPCAQIAPGAWTDVTEPAAFGSVGLVLDPGAWLELYVAADHPLRPRQAPLHLRGAPDVSIEAFRPAADPASFELALTRDAIDTTSALGSASYVYRVVARSRPRRASQVALRLGGFGTYALARIVGSEAAVKACAAMRGGAGLLARLRARATTDRINIRNDDLFVHGWERAERAVNSVFRWTNTNRAEMLLPLSEVFTGAFELDARALVEGSELRVRVNDTQLAPMALSTRSRTYSWPIEPTMLRAGMNRIWIDTDRLARPSDLGGSGDIRSLGVAVEAVRLRLTARTEPDDRD